MQTITELFIVFSTNRLQKMTASVFDMKPFYMVEYYSYLLQNLQHFWQTVHLEHSQFGTSEHNSQES